MRPSSRRCHQRPGWFMRETPPPLARLPPTCRRCSAPPGTPWNPRPPGGRPCVSVRRRKRVVRAATPRPAGGTWRAVGHTGGRRRRRRAGVARTGAPRRRRRSARGRRGAKPRPRSGGTRRTTSGGKRGSRNAAATAFSRTSAPSARRASSDPMHPRSSPSCRSVTKVGPGATSARVPFPVLPGKPELRADRIARNREQRPPEVTIPHGSLPRRMRTRHNRRRASGRRPCRPSCGDRAARARARAAARKARGR